MKRADFLEHVSWTGAGLVWSLSAAGVLEATPADAKGHKPSSFSFVQISDSHIGFTRPENTDVAGTLTKTVAAINALQQQPAFVMHTGDITHLSKPEQFDSAKQILSTLKAPLLTTPGEHDVIGSPDAYFAAFKNGDAKQGGWHSWDQGGIHFVNVVNVFNFEVSGKLGNDQLDWVEKDLAAQKPGTPIVVFGHVPLYALYPDWGWGTDDAAEALKLLARFGSVTVLNGHIHQIAQKVEGRIAFHTARSTAFPQPAPGTAPGPGPLKVPAEQLHEMLGITDAMFVRGHDRIALIDSTLTA